MATKKKAAKRVKPGTSKDAREAKVNLFIEAYLTNGGNGRQAALAAGYTENSADTQAWRLLKDVRVLQRIEERQKLLAQKYELTTESVIKSLAQAVHFDPRKMFNADGSLRQITDLDDDTAMALAGFEVTEDKGERGKVIGYTKKVKWLDKNTAREQAMKHLGLYLEDNKQKSPLEGVSRETLKLIVEKLNGKR